MRKHKRGTRPEIVGRYFSIASWSFSLYIRANRQRGLPIERDSSSTLSFEGALLEPLGGQTAIAGLIFAKDQDQRLAPDAEYPYIGGIIGIRPRIDLVTELTLTEFSWLVSMVSGDRIKAGYLASTEPYRGKAKVVSLSFNDRLPEDL